MTIDLSMEVSTPPTNLSEEQKAILANIRKVKEANTGKWHRIARFDSKSAGSGRASTLRKREDMDDYEFQGGVLDPEDNLIDPDDPSKGSYLSGLWCRFVPPELPIAGGAGRPPGRPPR